MTMREVAARVSAFFRRREIERDFKEELSAHIELATQDFLQQGMTQPEARRLALLKLGGIEPARELHREALGLPWLDGLVQDLRYAIRMLRRSPGFTAVAGLSLALGIGANTAIFTLIESTLLRPIPVKNMERLRLLTWREQWGGWVPPGLGYLSPTFGTIYEQRETPDGGLMHTDFAPALYREFLHDNTVFESLFTFKELGRVTAVADGSAEPVNCFLVSGDFYKGMDVSPVIGRAVWPENDVLSSENQVVVISYEYWTRRFGRSPSAIGKTITLNGVPVSIIGVNPEYFTGIEPGAHFEIWAPMSLAFAISGHSFLADESEWPIPMMGRLKRGVEDAQAQSELDAIFQAYVDGHPGPQAGLLKDPVNRPRLLLQSAARGLDYLNERYGRLLLAVLALAGLVLLIACANVANLLLAKSAVRQREISLRLALGAGRSRIVRQLLTEGLLLASMAGIAGVILGYWTRDGIPALLRTPWRPSLFDTAFDPKILLASIAITFFTGILFSLAPVWQARRVEVNEALMEGSHGTASLSKLRVGRVLVALQVALCVLLLAGAGLCVKTFANLKNAPLGFEPKGVLLFSLDPTGARYSGDRLGAFLTELQEHLNAIPGVRSATFSVGFRQNYVGSRFFETMGIPILEGRAIEAHDGANTPLVAVVNRRFASQHFPEGNAVGRTFKGDGGRMYRIVGVCGDWRTDLHEMEPTEYTALVQAPPPGGRIDLHRIIDFEVKTTEVNIVKQIRQVVRSLDSNLLVTDVRTQEQQIENGLTQEQLMASLAVVFGALALILASIGIYGVIAYAVERRTHEIGIRMALGARPGRVAWMILREALTLAAAGITIGVPMALALIPVMNHAIASGWRQGFAYGVKPDDPATIAAAVVVLAAVGFAAGYLPARRAARVDPMTALRHD